MGGEFSKPISNISASETFATNGMDFLKRLLVTTKGQRRVPRGTEEKQVTSCVAGFCPESTFTADRKYNGN